MLWFRQTVGLLNCDLGGNGNIKKKKCNHGDSGSRMVGPASFVDIAACSAASLSSPAFNHSLYSALLFF